MPKVILFDVDGVVIKKHGYFSDLLAKDYGIPKEKIMSFFNGEFKNCSLGKADLKEEISKYLSDWGWEKSVEELLRYWFESEKEVDPDVLAVVQKLRGNGTKCYLATNQEKYRLEYLLKTVGLEKYFDGWFVSCELGHTKTEKEFYEKVVERLDIKPEKITFWDGDKKIVKIAKESGINASLFINIDSLRK